MYTPVQVGQATINNFSTSVETDILIFNDPKVLQKPVLSFYYNVSMGSATELDLRYYAAFVYKATASYAATDWFQLPGKGTGTISNVTDGYLRVVSTLSFVDSLSIDGSVAFLPAVSGLKVTGKGAGAATSSVILVAMTRDN